MNISIDDLVGICMLIFILGFGAGYGYGNWFQTDKQLTEFKKKDKKQ